MTTCVVTCHDCMTKVGPKKWHWLCETCAEECQDKHRRETGHQTELFVAVEDINEVQVLVAEAARSVGW